MKHHRERGERKRPPRGPASRHCGCRVQRHVRRRARPVPVGEEAPPFVRSPSPSADSGATFQHSRGWSLGSAAIQLVATTTWQVATASWWERPSVSVGSTPNPAPPAFPVAMLEERPAFERSTTHHPRLDGSPANVPALTRSRNRHAEAEVADAPSRAGRAKRPPRGLAPRRSGCRVQRLVSQRSREPPGDRPACTRPRVPWMR